MADVVYRGNLKAASFPLLTELHGRTVIVKGQDQNFIGGLAAKESLDSSIGVPQIYYCHNVIPTDGGYKSVAYDEYTVDHYADNAGFTEIRTLRNGNGDSALFSTDASGNMYVLPAGATTWIEPTGAPLATVVAGKRVTVAFVSGVTYIYVSRLGCYIFDWNTNNISTVTLTGLDTSQIIGISSDLGYLIAYTEDSIAWSSTISPEDFTPDLATGAGGGSIEGAEGKIITITKVYGGMIVFCADNAVGAIASGNPRYPYNFVPITGAAGLSSPDNVTEDTGAGMVYSYSKAGLQQVTMRGANMIMPEITDFISGGRLEDLDERTREFTITDATGQELHKRLVLISSRYLVFSYGVNSLTHALYYDLAYKQFGRLKIDHVDCFEFTAYSDGIVEIPKKTVAFLKSSGAIEVLDSDISAPGQNGVLLLGKFQYARSRLLQLQGVEFESGEVSCYDYPSMDGKNLENPIEGYIALDTPLLSKFNFHNTALNHSLLFMGSFNATSFVLTFNVGGGR